MDIAVRMSRGPARDRMAIAAILSAMALVVLDSGMVNIALPTIGEGLAEAPARTLTIVTAYQLALLVGLLPCAQIADRIGYRRLFVAGVALFGTSSLLCALAPTLPLLVAARFAQGLGGAAIMSLGIALLRLALGSDRLGSAIAWNALVVASCSALAPAAGALLISGAGWRWIFVIGLPIAAMALAASPALPAVRANRQAVDPLSMILHALVAAGLVAAANVATANPMLAAGLVAGALACALWLILRERGKPMPLLPFDLLAHRPFRASVAASIFFFTAQSAGLLALPFYLQLSHGRGAIMAGLMVALWPLAVAATSPAANRLAICYSSRAVCTAGGLVLAAGLAASALWPIGESIAPIAACAMICGMGFGLFQVPNNRNMFLAAPADRSAAAGGLQGTARLAGQTAGALLMTIILSVVPMSLAPRLAMGLGAIAALIAGWLSWRRQPYVLGAKETLSHSLSRDGPIAAVAP